MKLATLTATAATALALGASALPAHAAPPPAVTIDDVVVTEGNTGMSPPTYATFAVHLDHMSPLAVTVDWATGNGTAVSPADYGGAAGHVTFAPHQVKQTITIRVRGDLDCEKLEFFRLNLTGAANAQVQDNQALGWILNDDGNGIAGC